MKARWRSPRACAAGEAAEPRRPRANQVEGAPKSRPVRAQPPIGRHLQSGVHVQRRRADTRLSTRAARYHARPVIYVCAHRSAGPRNFDRRAAGLSSPSLRAWLLPPPTWSLGGGSPRRPGRTRFRAAIRAHAARQVNQRAPDSCQPPAGEDAFLPASRSIALLGRRCQEETPRGLLRKKAIPARGSCACEVIIAPRSRRNSSYASRRRPLVRGRRSARLRQITQLIVSAWAACALTGGRDDSPGAPPRAACSS